MAKELIISANVHEKKVAILEDGLVTEFYVERRDENQGVVGNLYKGRVMKVLPGMQSAFVDIALERDAFLYVSDFTEFMEEEDAIDFKEMAEEKRPQPPRQDDRGRRDDRRQRGRETVAAAPPPAFEAVTDEAAESPELIEDVVEQLAEIMHESVIQPPPDDEEGVGASQLVEIQEAVVQSEMVGPQGPQVVFEKVTDDHIAEAAPVVEEGAEAAAPVEDKRRRGRSRRKDEEAEPAKPTQRGGKKTGGAKEAVAETKATPAKGTTKAAGGRGPKRRGAKGAEKPETAKTPQAALPLPQFERVTDEDREVEAGELLKDAILQEKIIERVHQAEYKIQSVHAEPEPEWRVGSFRPHLSADPGLHRVVDEQEAAAARPEAALESGLIEGEAAEPEVTPFRHISEAVSNVLSDLTRAGVEEEAEGEDLMDVAPEGGTVRAESNSADREPEEDGEAEVRAPSWRGEFAVRRGGRGRRRPPRREAAPAPVAEEEKPAAAGEEEEVQGTEARQERKSDGQRRPASAPSRRPERGVPTISELLHEGQEILVQIAKEPIAKKGARITSHIALPGRYLVYMPTVNHVGVSRKIASEAERVRLKRTVAMLREREANNVGGFIARTACAGHTEQELQDDMRYLVRTWADIRKKADRAKAPALVHRDLDLVQRIMRDQLNEDFTAIRVDNEVEYARIVEFVNRVQPRLVKRVKLYTGNQPIFEKHGVQAEIDKAVKPRVWLKSGGYIVINQTEALVAIDVNTGKFVGKSDKLEDTITRTNLEAAKEIVRQVRLRDLGGIIVIDFIDMEERKNRQRVMMALQQELQSDRSPSKILSINDFGLVAITRKRVKQSLERTLCTPCPYCQGAGMVKSPQTMCFEILEQAKAVSRQDLGNNDVMLRVSPVVAEALHTSEREVFEEIEAYFGTPITIEADPNLHQEQYDFAIM